MRKLIALLLVLLTAFAVVPAFAQDGDTQTFVAQGGLVFDYPADWVANEFFGTIVVGSDAESADAFTPTTPDSVVMGMFYGPASELSDTLQEDFTDVAGLRETLLASLLESEGTLIEDATVALGGRDVLVIIGESEGETSIIYLLTVEDQLVLAFASAVDVDTVSGFRSDLDAIIASMRYDPTAAPTISDGSDVATDAAAVGEGAFVYYQSLEQDTTNYVGLGSLAQVVQLPDGTVLVDDGQSLFTLDLETGALSNRVQSDDFFFSLQSIAAAPDGTLWGFDYTDGLVNVDTQLSQLSATGGETFGDAFVDSVAVDAAGNVFVFVPIYDEEYNSTGTVFVFDSTGAQTGSFVTNGDPDEFGIVSFDVGISIFPQADGNLLLMDDSLNYKVVDTSGNLVDGPAQFGDDADFFFAAAFDIADDGTLYALSYDGELRQYAPSGELLATVGTEQADSEGPFSLGELPNYGDLLALDSNRVLLVGSNFTYSLVTLIDFSAAE